MCQAQCSNKSFLTYVQQIEKLEGKKLKIENIDVAIHTLERFSYFSLISGYKDIFKDGSTKNFIGDIDFNELVKLYAFDEELRSLFLKFILKLERHIKSLYSYAFCQQHGELQAEYLNVNNFNYSQYQDEVNKLVNMLRNLATDQYSKHKYVKHCISNHNNVPLWVLVSTLSFGNMSKMYDYSLQKIQSKVAKEFPWIYPTELSSMLSVISKFRNVCAHNERLYNYRTQKSILNLPMHSKMKILKKGNEFSKGKNDLFSIVISFAYLLDFDEYNRFFTALQVVVSEYEKSVTPSIINEVLNSMGFPENWEDAIHKLK